MPVAMDEAIGRILKMMSAIPGKRSLPGGIDELVKLERATLRDVVYGNVGQSR
jgi:hypothetical protein